MLAEELFAEAEQRASSPDGMAMLVHLLLNSWEEELAPKVIKLSVDVMARIFHEFGVQNLTPTEFLLHPRDWLDLMSDHRWYAVQLEFDAERWRSGIQGTIFGVPIRQNPRVEPGTVSVSTTHNRSYTVCFRVEPEEQRLRRLLKTYVAAKRQFAMWKRGDEFEPQYEAIKQRHLDIIAKYRVEVHSLADRLGDVGKDIMKQFGATVAFNPAVTPVTWFTPNWLAN